MQLISYFLSMLATVICLCEPYFKNMKTILVFEFTGNLLVAISYFLVSGYSGASICFVACLLVMVNYYFTNSGKTIPKYYIAIYVLLFLGINFLTFKHWYDVFSLTASILFVLCVSQSDAKYYRFIFIVNSTVWIIYDLLAKAYGNLLTHIILLSSTLIAILIRDIKGKKSDKNKFRV